MLKPLANFPLSIGSSVFAAVELILQCDEFWPSGSLGVISVGVGERQCDQCWRRGAAGRHSGLVKLHGSQAS